MRVKKLPRLKDAREEVPHVQDALTVAQPTPPLAEGRDKQAVPAD